MSVQFTVFSPTSGQILRSGRAPSVAHAMAQPEQSEDVLIGVRGSDTTQYVLDGALADRPTIPDLNTIPPSTQVTINGTSHGVCDDGFLELETDIPGTYTVRLDPPFPYQPYETDVVIP